MLELTVVIPVFNDMQSLARCLAALKRTRLEPCECIVVDDGSSDGSGVAAEQAGATVIKTPCRMGPAAARNLGAVHATGDILVFIDSDVCVHRDTLGRIQARFSKDPALDALIGSYDDEPEGTGLVSQYKNLFHHFVHQHGRKNASTFWTGCGAIRRELFLQSGGFDESYARPSIEDIALGYRLRFAGHRIVLDPKIQVKHLKVWNLRSLLATDIRDRALPWTRLILRSLSLPNDLNVRVSERLTGVSVLALICLALAMIPTGHLALSWAPLLAAIGITAKFYRFIGAKRGWLLAAGVVPLHLAYYIYSTLAFSVGVLCYCAVWRWQPEASHRSLEPIGLTVLKSAGGPDRLRA